MTWLSQLAQGNNVVREVLLSSQTWVKPAGVDVVDIILVGGGGGGSTGHGGGGGEIVIARCPVFGNVDVVIGAGGSGGEPTGVAGGLSSFGPYIKAVGGGSGAGAVGGSALSNTGGGVVTRMPGLLLFRIQGGAGLYYEAVTALHPTSGGASFGPGGVDGEAAAANTGGGGGGGAPAAAGHNGGSGRCEIHYVLGASYLTLKTIDLGLIYCTPP
jgi:hypothetical protein